jgi:putative PIN family toxin of toxin-antitoxin system
VYVAELGQYRRKPGDIWMAARQGRYCLLVSPEILREVARVLRLKFDWKAEPLQRQVRLIVDTATVVATSSVLGLVAADPDDNRILECAVDGGADLIVSNDHHLLDLKTCRGIPIVAGPDFRRILGRILGLS